MENYQKLAARTINNGLISMELQEIQAANFAIGLSDEFNEFLFEVLNNSSVEKLEDEISDCRWYSAALATIYRLKEAEFTVPELDIAYYLRSKDPVFSLLIQWSIHIGKIQAYVKKSVFHKKLKPVEEMKQLLETNQAFFLAVCLLLDLDPDRVERHNIEKLEKRHSTGSGVVAFSFATANAYKERGGE